MPGLTVHHPQMAGRKLTKVQDLC